MRKNVLSLILVFVMGVSAYADFATTPYLVGDFNSWDPGLNLMAETSPGSGVWTYTVTGQPVGVRQEFKITDGTWDSNYPEANSWYYTDENGSVTITFNTNTVNDGWLPAQYRLGLSTDPGTWTLAGGFQGWDNANPATAMTSLGHGIYKYTVPAGDQTFKSVVTGSWDSISLDGRSVGTADYNYYSAEDFDVYVDALAGTIGINADISKDYLPHDPDPNDLEQDVVVSGLTLSWSIAQVPTEADPNILVADPNLVSHKLYRSDGNPADPNLYYVDAIVGWDTETLRASYTPAPALNTDSTYLWRVDMVVDDSNDIQGFIWSFDTELSTPIITGHPAYQVVAQGTPASFSVTVSSMSTPTYQWYKYVDGISDDELVDAGNISGATTDTLTVSGVQLADEGKYYCVVSNDATLPIGTEDPEVSNMALLGMERLIAYWPFESNDADSTVAGSPVSYFYNDPAFVTTGIVGDAMEFDNDENSEDILYIDPDASEYFDICNYSMTVACWIQSSWAQQWGPMVARNGEDSGWQLRHRGDTLDRICFTTRGTQNDDGTASNRTVYDGQWHYVVATFDGTEKKVYIDGVLSRVLSSDDGSIAQESDATGGMISASPSPVSMAGRVTGDPINGLVFEDVTPCILDEVEIYNHVLDAATIAQNYADIAETGVCPTPLQYDLNDDCIINLDDFALLASTWLTDTSVQPTP